MRVLLRVQRICGFTQYYMIPILRLDYSENLIFSFHFNTAHSNEFVHQCTRPSWIQIVNYCHLDTRPFPESTSTCPLEPQRSNSLLSVSKYKLVYSNVPFANISNSVTDQGIILLSSDLLCEYLWPLLLTWFNFNPSMDK